MSEQLTFARVATRFQRLLKERYSAPVWGQQFGSGGGFLAAPHVTTGEFGIGTIGLIGQGWDTAHPDWWQLIVRHPMQPSVNDPEGTNRYDPDMDVWPVHGAEWVFDGNDKAALRDLTLIALSEFAFRDCFTPEGEHMEWAEAKAASSAAPHEG